MNSCSFDLWLDVLICLGLKSETLFSANQDREENELILWKTFSFSRKNSFFLWAVGLPGDRPEMISITYDQQFYQEEKRRLCPLCKSDKLQPESFFPESSNYCALPDSFSFYYWINQTQYQKYWSLININTNLCAIIFSQKSISFLWFPQK